MERHFLFTLIALFLDGKFTHANEEDVRGRGPRGDLSLMFQAQSSDPDNSTFGRSLFDGDPPKYSEAGAYTMDFCDRIGSASRSPPLGTH